MLNSPPLFKCRFELFTQGQTDGARPGPSRVQAPGPLCHRGQPDPRRKVQRGLGRHRLYGKPHPEGNGDSARLPQWSVVSAQQKAELRQTPQEQKWDRQCRPHSHSSARISQPTASLRASASSSVTGEAARHTVPAQAAASPTSPCCYLPAHPTLTPTRMQRNETHGNANQREKSRVMSVCSESTHMHHSLQMMSNKTPICTFQGKHL